jgi:hypothetical protein
MSNGKQAKDYASGNYISSHKASMKKCSVRKGGFAPAFAFGFKLVGAS